MLGLQRSAGNAAVTALVTGTVAAGPVAVPAAAETVDLAPAVQRLAGAPGSVPPPPVPPGPPVPAEHPGFRQPK